jgi:hypothetical protein
MFMILILKANSLCYTLRVFCAQPKGIPGGNCSALEPGARSALTTCIYAATAIVSYICKIRHITSSIRYRHHP